MWNVKYSIFDGVFFFFSLCAAVILFFSREENKTPSLKRCVCSTAVALNSSAQDLWDPIALCFAGHRFNWWKALSVKILFLLRTRAGILFKVLFKKKIITSILLKCTWKRESPKSSAERKMTVWGNLQLPTCWWSILTRENTLAFSWPLSHGFLVYKVLPLRNTLGL